MTKKTEERGTTSVGNCPICNAFPVQFIDGKCYSKELDGEIIYRYIDISDTSRNSVLDEVLGKIEKDKDEFREILEVARKKFQKGVGVNEARGIYSYLDKLIQEIEQMREIKGKKY